IAARPRPARNKTSQHRRCRLAWDLIPTCPVKNQPPDLSMIEKSTRRLYPLLVLAVALVGLWRGSLSQGDADLRAPGLPSFPTTLARGATLFENVRIFDGKSAALSSPSNALVRGNTIERISADPISVEGSAVRVIAADGRVLMSGLIDAH